VGAVLSVRGVLLTAIITAALVVAAWYGRVAIPATPMVMVDGAVGHGTLSSYECLPGAKRIMRIEQLDGLRCGSWVTEPGGLSDPLVHVWTHEGRTVWRTAPSPVAECDGPVYRSYLRPHQLPEQPLGAWTCRIETSDGQLVGLIPFDVVVSR
ncbi:MAG: DUF2914 domain-containing protein, partial [Myxococcota bacterium]